MTKGCDCIDGQLFGKVMDQDLPLHAGLFMISLKTFGRIEVVYNLGQSL